MHDKQKEWEEKLSLTTLLKHQVWTNPTNHQSLRLTKMAFEIVQNNPLLDPFFRIRLDDGVLVNKIYLQLERHFTVPYYIYGYKTIFVYQGIEVTMLGLNDGNLKQYLENLANF